LPQNHYIKPNAKIRACDAEDVLELLKCRDQKLTVDGLFEISKQGPLENSQKSEPKERTVTVSNLTEGLRFIEADIRVFDDTDSNEQLAAAKRGIMRIIACYEEVLKEEKKRSLPLLTSALDFFKSYSGNRVSPHVNWR
jgi:hypothetical protein